MAISTKSATKNTGFRNFRHPLIQASFLTRLGALMTEGFTLREALRFLATMMKKEAPWVEGMMEELESGHRFDEILKAYGFPDRVTSQIFLALVHGEFSEALLNSGQYMEDREKQKRQLKKLLRYPAVLLIFLSVILLLMRIFLLPNLRQLTSSPGGAEPLISRLAVGFIEMFPGVIVIGVVIILFLIWLLQQKTKKISAMEKADIYATVPFLSILTKLHYTQQFSYEWSLLLKSGYQMNRIVSLMQSKETPALMQEVADKIERELKNGQNLKDILMNMHFFTAELGLIVSHGEQTGHLAKELRIYAENCQRELQENVQKLMGWIQPAVFLIIAFFILCVYLALLLPLFTMIEEGF